jgi:cold shock CspA family protein
MSTELRRLGRVKWFDSTKGFGFIVPQDPMPELRGGDLFVHISAFNGLDPTLIVADTCVTFSLVSGHGRHSARLQAAEVKLV